MIFASPGRDEKLLPLFREAGRLKSMMVAERSSFFLRAILFLFILFVVPRVLRAGALDDSALKLAGDISAQLPPGAQSSCEFTNLSSIPDESVAAAEQSFRKALRSVCVLTSTPEAAAIDISITLSENWKGFVWTAQIRTSAGTKVLLATAPRALEERSVEGAMPMSLKVAKVWEGPQKILGFASVRTPDGQYELWLLTDQYVVLREIQGNAVSQLQLPSPSPSRVPIGWLDQANEDDKDVVMYLPGKTCAISIAIFGLTGCHVTEVPQVNPDASPHANVKDVPQQIQSTYIQYSLCPSVLMSGLGDDTEKDFIQLFQTAWPPTHVTGTPLSAPVFFPGPVVSIGGLRGIGVVVHNLESGNYEAYRAFFSCDKK